MEKRFCIQCGVEFDAKRADAKFCSQACQKAHGRDKGMLSIGFDPFIRGSRAGDVLVTAMGIEVVICRKCRGGYRRWLESKLARLVRNSLEGLAWGTAKEFGGLYREEFDKRMVERRAEWVYCSDECAGVGSVEAAKNEKKA